MSSRLRETRYWQGTGHPNFVPKAAIQTLVLSKAQHLMCRNGYLPNLLKLTYSGPRSDLLIRAPYCPVLQTRPREHPTMVTYQELRIWYCVLNVAHAHRAKEPRIMTDYRELISSAATVLVELMYHSIDSNRPTTIGVMFRRSSNVPPVPR